MDNGYRLHGARTDKRVLDLMKKPGLYQRLWQIQADLETEIGSESEVEAEMAKAQGSDPPESADQEWKHVATS